MITSIDSGLDLVISSMEIPMEIIMNKLLKKIPAI